MELMPGYKQTEAGVIPEDWETPVLGMLFSFKNGLNKGKEFFGYGTPIVNYMDVYGHPGIFAGDLKGRVDVNRQELETYEVKRGDVFFTRTSETVAEIGIASVLLDDSPNTVFSGFILRARPKNGSVNDHFKKFCFSSSLVRKQITSKSTYTTRALINGRVLSAITLPLPPFAEQGAIAEALSDADALIESLVQLIAKKRHIKQGAIQELLRTKLKYEVRLLRDVSTLKGRIGWQGLKQSEFTSNEDEPFLITGMNFKDGAIRWNEVYHISEPRYEMAKDIQLREGDLLMTKDGTIGKVLYIDTIPHPGKASLNSHLLLFRPIRESYNSKFLYYQLSSQRFKDFIELSKSGTTFFGLSQAAVGNYPVLLPPMEDQVRIASILSDMDSEIAALETKLTKTRSLKQGMMEELLTGKTRLI